MLVEATALLANIEKRKMESAAADSAGNDELWFELIFANPRKGKISHAHSLFLAEQFSKKEERTRQNKLHSN